MAFLSRRVFLFFLLINVSGVSAQQSGIGNDEVYGSDPLLYNGKFYTFFPPLNTGGDQFLADRRFESGSVTLRGVTYKGVMLNYDIYNQQLILKYKNIQDATNLIIISDAWLESFSYRGMNFEIISVQDTLKQIFQVIGTGTNRLMYHWTKTLSLEGFHGSKNHIFTDAKKEMNIFDDGQNLKYWNNRSFYSLFSPEKGTAVKEYLRRQNINVKKATDQTMTELMIFCNAFHVE